MYFKLLSSQFSVSVTIGIHCSTLILLGLLFPWQLHIVFSSYTDLCDFLVESSLYNACVSVIFKRFYVEFSGVVRGLFCWLIDRYLHKISCVVFLYLLLLYLAVVCLCFIVYSWFVSSCVLEGVFLLVIVFEVCVIDPSSSSSNRYSFSSLGFLCLGHIHYQVCFIILELYWFRYCTSLNKCPVFPGLQPLLPACAIIFLLTL